MRVSVTNIDEAHLLPPGGVARRSEAFPNVGQEEVHRLGQRTNQTDRVTNHSVRRNCAHELQFASLPPDMGVKYSAGQRVVGPKLLIHERNAEDSQTGMTVALPSGEKERDIMSTAMLSGQVRSLSSPWMRSCS